MYSGGSGAVLVIGLVLVVSSSALILGSGLVPSPSHAPPVGKSGLPGAVEGSPMTSPVKVRASVFMPHFMVNFTETGLPGGTLWEVGTVNPSNGFVVSNSSAKASIDETWANGTYSFSASADAANYTPAQSNSTFTVAGSNLSVPVQFYPSQLVTFVETGLGQFHPWDVVIHANGTVSNETRGGSQISIAVPVGHFNYSISSLGFNATPRNGSGNVTSGPVQIPISFVAILPPPGYLAGVCNVGTAALYLNGLRTLVNLGGGFSFTLEPGLYSIIVTATGYVSYYNETYVTSGNTTHLYITLQGLNSTAPPVPTSVPGIDTEGWIFIGGLAAGVCILGIVAGLFARKARRARMGPSPPTP